MLLLVKPIGKMKPKCWYITKRHFQAPTMFPSCFGQSTGWSISAPIKLGPKEFVGENLRPPLHGMSRASKAKPSNFISTFHYIFPGIQVVWNLLNCRGHCIYQTKQCMIITKHCHTLKHFSIKFDPSKISPLWRSIIDPASLPTGTLIGYSVEWHVEGWSVCAQLNTCVFRLLKSSKCNC